MTHTMDDETRFRALFDVAYPALVRYARHRALSRSEADDLVAETLLVAWRRLDAVPHDDPIPWLFAVARNVARNHERGARRRARLLARVPRTVAAPPDPVRDPDELPAITRALDALSPDDRDILVLVAWDELQPAQLAVALECSNGAARVRLHRARERFAKALEIERNRATPARPRTDPDDTTARPERNSDAHS